MLAEHVELTLTKLGQVLSCQQCKQNFSTFLEYSVWLASQRLQSVTAVMKLLPKRSVTILLIFVIFGLGSALLLHKHFAYSSYQILHLGLFWNETRYF
jgi:hypothetical protein